MMALVRRTPSVCPVCCQSVEAEIVLEDGKVFLDRTCPEHGPWRFLLSVNGALYADLDRFFNGVLDSRNARGRITNYWVISTVECQKNCAYCSVETGGGRFREMSWEELKSLIHDYKTAKLTLSGGEPTLHPKVLDFFREARANGVVTQMASNGIELADPDFCAALKEAGLTEVRLSIESTDPAKADEVGTSLYIEEKRQALDNLKALDIATILSPTVFKGVNEEELINAVEYAKDKPFVHSISVNGFSWIGRGADMQREKMIMPDEMMDVLYNHYFKSDREDIYTFQKALYALLDVVNIRLCLYTQIMVFARYPDKVIPITEYINMPRMKRGMRWWERCASSNRLVRGLALGLVFAGSLKIRTLRLFPAVAAMFLANMTGIKVTKYPQRLLAVILNTNCSPLSYDEVVGRQCMSGLITGVDSIEVGDSSSSIIRRERRRYMQEAANDAEHTG